MTDSLILVGYFPKKVVHPSDWLKAPRVTRICSVSTCISDGPEGWLEHWEHNDLGFYPTQAVALSMVPETLCPQFEIHAYRMLLAEFLHGARRPVERPGLQVQPLAQGYESVGFDAVSRSVSPFFDCSPLSCNGMAEEIETNEHCLLPDLETAEQVAMRFSREEPEPGSYYVFEVLRRPPPTRATDDRCSQRARGLDSNTDAGER